MRKLLALALLGALALGGCSKVTTETNATHEGRNPWTRPGRLVIGTAGEEPDNLNEMFAHTDATDQVVQFLFEPCFRYDPNGEFLPAACSDVPTVQNGGISRDGKTVTLHFRKGMKWSDGAPYDARDFVFTWKAVMNPSNAAKLQLGWEQIRAIDLRDDNTTAVIHLKNVYSGLLGVFAVGGAAVPPLPAHVLASVTDLRKAPFNAKPLSSGPFVLAKWNHGSSLEFDANPNYWRGKPGLDHISYKVVPNADTLFNQLQTHEVDMYNSVPEADVDRLKSLQGYTVTKALSANYRRLEFNTAKPNLSDVRVRRAIAMAVDWDSINRTIYHGYNIRAVSDVLPSSWAAPTGFTNDPYDPKRAAALLDEAGWKTGPDGRRYKNGRPFETSISTTPSKQANVQAEQVIQQQLKAVGLTMEIKNYPPSLLFSREGPVYTGKYDSEFTIATNAPDPDNEGLWSATQIPPHGGNTSFVRDPIITQTSHDALLTFDRAKRKALYQREEQRIHDLVPVVYLYWQTSFSAINSDLKNYKPASYISDYWNCWEWTI